MTGLMMLLAVIAFVLAALVAGGAIDTTEKWCQPGVLTNVGLALWAATSLVAVARDLMTRRGAPPDDR